MQLLRLLEIANFCAINSESHTWDIKPNNTVVFINTNTHEQVVLPLHQQAIQHQECEYEFQLPETNKTIWIAFYSLVPITPDYV